jgi:hypothetical protein
MITANVNQNINQGTLLEKLKLVFPDTGILI